ncbi:four helix bundle protein [Candidatus Sulfidibacterium hydrothermale]|uniref:four helix bundle protein n=1 Tax=Candidatus Sulfidibacterium hydrothermale TaxID=2875962 RepID=UPI001F0A6F6E|nr:four helix bundle protein [Candidatus Sulfidibacterium hydrothermale]UBM62471.1 four helix bundle protein [Candidatus Sulfidibacterium hydrothermale]
MKINNFEDLEVWQEARKLAKFVFQITSKEPFVKDYRFRDQIRAAAGSIMDNLAEGFGRDGNKEFSNFLSIAKGSNEEVRSQSYRAFDYEYISEEVLKELLERTDKLSRKIKRFMNYLKNSPYKGTKFRL